MEFMLKFPLIPSAHKITYHDRILLIGSCFTEEIGQRLGELKFNICQNPGGILFDPLSIARSLERYVAGIFSEDPDLVNYNELWHSWEHHSTFSCPNKFALIEKIAGAGNEAMSFTAQGNWIIITFGISYVYRLIEQDKYVANCHKAPASWFEKELIPVERSFEVLQNAISKIKQANPGLKFILTVSPVRHIKDGIVENNRSKARLIELAHLLEEKNDNVSYFGSYEIVMDVLRDYRFYKEDLVHPNDFAVKYVFGKFSELFFANDTLDLMKEIDKLLLAKKHRAFQPGSSAFRSFLDVNLEKAKVLKEKHPELDLERELRYFETGLV